MREMKLTKRAVEAVSYTAKGQKLYRDTELRGFGLRVGKRSKAFFVETQVNKQTVRYTIGDAEVLPAEVARKRAYQMKAKMQDGINPNRERREEREANITLEAAFELFQEVRPNLASSTLDSYTRTFTLYLRAWLKRPIADIDRQDVLVKHNALTKERGAYTANAVMRHFRSVYNCVSATRVSFPENPVNVLRLARAWHSEQRRQTVIPSHRLPHWWAVVEGEAPHVRDFLFVGLCTGMRRNEITTLKWENVDLIGNTIHVPRTKNGDPLDLPLSPFVAELLSERQELVGQSEWVFPGVGRSGHLVEVKGFVSRVSEASGVSFTMHDLRRTFITIAESLDIPHYALKRLLNHRTVSDVTGGYIVINAERLREPVEKVNLRILELANAG